MAVIEKSPDKKRKGFGEAPQPGLEGAPTKRRHARRDLSDEQAREELAELVAEKGEFKAHNIFLTDNVATMDANEKRGHGRHGRFVALATALFGEDLTGLKMLDLACFEGMSAIEFAKRGADAVGVEIRDENLDRARGAAKILGLDNVEFHTDDIRNVNRETYGEFDIIVCSGILYHLDAPDVFEVVRDLAAMCTRVFIVDTTTSPRRPRSFEFEGNEYFGRYVVEHNEGDDDKTKMDRPWASADNEKSFILTRPSLINIMARSGISCVSELKMPFKYKEGFHRTTFYGFPSRADTSLAGDKPFAEEPHQPSRGAKRQAPNAVNDVTAERSRQLQAQRAKAK